MTALRNLAAQPEMANVVTATVRDELAAVGVEAVEVPLLGREVPSKVEGRLWGFTFRRAWRYWVVEGSMPLALAEKLYAHPIGKLDVRVAGHCACPPPAQWAKHFAADGKEILPKSQEPTDEQLVEGVMGNIYARIKHRYHFADDPAAVAHRSVIDTYHVDSLAGLRLLVDAISGEFDG